MPGPLTLRVRPAPAPGQAAGPVGRRAGAACRGRSAPARLRCRPLPAARQDSPGGGGAELEVAPRGDRAGGAFGIALDGVSKVFGSRAVVDGISISIQEGEIVGLLGPNGAGKSTTFSMIVGTQVPTRGSVWLEDGGGGARSDITHLPLHRRARMGLGYLPQDASIFRGLSVHDNLLLAMEASGVPPESRAGKLKVLLEEFGLEHVSSTPGRALSGGERRRAELARALAVEYGGRCARLLLVDEPFAGVDPIGVTELQGLLRQLRDTRGVGVLITDHNVASALEICDRAYMMYEGRVLAAGSPEEIVRDQGVRQFYLGD